MRPPYVIIFAIIQWKYFLFFKKDAKYGNKESNKRMQRQSPFMAYMQVLEM